MWNSVIVLNIETCTIVHVGIVALYCNKETNDAIQYNTMQVTKQRLDQSKQNDAKLLILGFK